MPPAVATSPLVSRLRSFNVALRDLGASLLCEEPLPGHAPELRLGELRCRAHSEMWKSSVSCHGAMLSENPRLPETPQCPPEALVIDHVDDNVARSMPRHDL